jgi:hypothetical protein
MARISPSTASAVAIEVGLAAIVLLLLIGDGGDIPILRRILGS